MTNLANTLRTSAKKTIEKHLASLPKADDLIVNLVQECEKQAEKGDYTASGIIPKEYVKVVSTAKPNLFNCFTRKTTYGFTGEGLAIEKYFKDNGVDIKITMILTDNAYLKLSWSE